MNENKDILHSRHLDRFFFLQEGAIQRDDSPTKHQRKILKVRLSETYKVA